MEIKEFFPFWKTLTADQQARLTESARPYTAKKGEVLHRGQADCLGLVCVCSGVLRAYTLSGEGREITLYRLYERDVCLFSASCAMRAVDFDIIIEADQESQLLVIPPDVYRRLMEQSAPASNFTNELMAGHFSDVMWLLDQVLNKKLDARLAAFLLEAADRENSDTLTLTHETIAGELGSAREVISRMMKYLQSEGLVAVSRGSVRLVDRPGLANLAGDSLR
ncbi:Crp/Fnr family transcriptional regulator [uncultured Ruthenibacterium sp.]|uniref:Crp/Fnr family transcriptional regulator n=1 Tax=uncultured Ruthenibacterium sp. TaxID=1905347 RepID=UPI00349EE6D1